MYPFEEPGIGPNKYNFDDKVVYTINVATGDNLAAGKPLGFLRVSLSHPLQNPGHDRAILSRRGRGGGRRRAESDPALHGAEGGRQASDHAAQRRARAAQQPGPASRHTTTRATTAKTWPAKAWPPGGARSLHRGHHLQHAAGLQDFRRPAGRRLLRRHPEHLRSRLHLRRPEQAVRQPGRIQRAHHGDQHSRHRILGGDSRSSACGRRPAGSQISVLRKPRQAASDRQHSARSVCRSGGRAIRSSAKRSSRSWTRISTTARTPARDEQDFSKYALAPELARDPRRASGSRRRTAPTSPASSSPT